MTDKLFHFFQKVPFFVVALETNGRVAFFNTRAEAITGCSLSDVTGHDFIERFILQEKKETFRDYFFRANGAKAVFDPFPCILNSKELKPYYMEWSGIKEKSPGGDLLFLCGKDLSENLSIISHLLTRILHEINNSTTFIIGNIPFLKEAWQDIQKITDSYYKEHADEEIARLPYNFFKEDYPQVIKDIETGCQRIKKVVEKFQEIERMTHDQKK